MSLHPGWRTPMTDADLYLHQILARELVDTGLLSPVRGVTSQRSCPPYSDGLIGSL